MSVIEGFEKGSARFYFNQYWAVTNPVILTLDELRETLFPLYEEIWNEVPKSIENRLSIIAARFKDRVCNGDPRRTNST